MKQLFENWRQYLNERADIMQEQDESYRMVKDPISGKRRMMRKSEYDDAMSQLDDEFATAGGMEQDIEARQKRGDFEQGDYGNVGPGGGRPGGNRPGGPRKR